MIAFTFRHNIDIKTVCILLLIENIIINLAFLSLNNNLIYTAAVFAFTAITLWYVRTDKLAKPIAILLVITLLAEIYWYQTDHPAPQIYFYFFKISLSLIVRFLLLYRPHGLNYYLDSGANILRLDWFVYKTIWVSCVIECAMICEFLIRHTLKINALYIYYSYEYIMHALAVWVLWLVVREAIKLQQQSLIQA
ncbi:hypothetical protein [Paraglaciecola hydrolytica]|uniref:hypothetical protein n=1 Tax=Paraglaciecola hydrolytica TaxID=1799789 RepID=UPI0010424267|nr:hypothetical protein [Paraglaciecola hydrolytica]